ncbi:hypothetical protein DRO48_03300 [Candidatus Bathyarchaeota archaeon]|nr:MAG: hypothetical protein DRO48_03300 [Candidatus Bathyarchaeota archaeon]
MSATTKTAALFIIGLIIGAAIGYGAAAAMAPARKPAAAGLTGEVKIVALLPLTGVLSTYGENSRAAVELAASEVNDWLEARGAPWRLKLIVEDTATDPATCLSKMKSWHGQGVLFFVGPQSSSEVKEVKAYADANKLLVIAQSSTSPALSIPGDFIYRYCPDDTIQGPGIAKLIWEAGVRHVIPTWRGDAWGDGLHDATREAFIALGGTWHDEYAVRYDPALTDFPAQAASLNDAVEALIAQGVPMEEIGIEIIAFEEAVPYMEDASEYPLLRQVKWFGSDGTCLLSSLVEHPVAGPFAADVKYTNTIFAPGVSPKFDYLKEYCERTLGRAPDSYAYAAYDIVWTLAIALDIVDAYDTEAVRAVLPKVVENYFGASGWFTLNENGDRAFADYNLWTVATDPTTGEVKWVQTGVYHGATGEIEWITPIYG